jgi:hypothetical protein
MSRRVLVAVVALVALGVLPKIAAAQGTPSADTPVVRSLDFSGALVNTAVPPILLGATQLPSLQRPVAFERPSNRPSALMLSLYASTAAMQMLDVHSTLTAVKQGASESNPLMKGLASNKAAFIAMKAGVAASTILASRNMAKRNKVAAIATMIAINSAYAFVVNHNYKVARNQR